MPYYDYQCTECDFILKDFYRRISENVSTMDCPKCGNEMKQLFGVSTLEFKGKGFYETDYHKKSISPPGEAHGKETGSKEQKKD